jgi:fimbrial chaperone protein
MKAIRSVGFSMLFVAQLASGAGSLRVAPTRLDLSPDQRTVALTVTNTGGVPTLLQIESKRWSQQTGLDEYTPADDLIVSPPIFTLEPGAEQIVRIARRDRRAPGVQLAYRLFVQEVLTPGNTSSRELNMVLRIGLPVFTTPASAPEPMLLWSLRCSDGSPPILIVSNRGGQAVRIDELDVQGASGGHTEHAIYVLAGAARVLMLNDLPATTRRLQLAGHTGSRRIEASAVCN